MKKMIMIVLFVVLLSNSVMASEHETIITNEQDVSTLVNEELEKGSISVAKAKVKKVGERTILEVEKGGFVKIGKRLYSNIGKGTFILDKKGNLVKAEITTNENKGVYTFEGISKKITVPPNTKIIYENGKVSFEKNKEYLIGEHKVKAHNDMVLVKDFITGDFVLDGIDVTDGITKLTDKGVLIEQGRVLYKGLKFEVVNDATQILIPNINADLSKFKGNFLRINDKDKTLEANTISNGMISLQVLETNKIFSLLDKKDRLLIKLFEGYGIKVTNREEKGLIPLMKPISGNQESLLIIENGLVKYFLSNGKRFYGLRYYGVEKGENPSLILAKRYESVPFIIERQDHIDKFGSANNLAFFDGDNGKLPFIISNSKYLPIDENLKNHRKMMTLNQLKESHPNIKFEVRTSLDATKDIVPPSTLRIIDKWLSDNEGKIITKRIILDDNFNAFATMIDSTTIGVGRIFLGIHSSSGEASEELRELGPLRILGHEYVHEQDEDYFMRQMQLTMEIAFGKEGDRLTGKSIEFKPIDSFYKEIGERGKAIIIEEIIKTNKKKCLKDPDHPVCNNIEFHSKRDVSIFPSLYGRSKSGEKYAKLAGVPYMYSLTSHIMGGFYRELPATVLELPYDKLIKLANERNKKNELTLRGKNIRKIVQLSFDTNKLAMSIDKYKKFIKETEGKECRTKDCIEFRCLEYKLICCQDFKNSPNCGPLVIKTDTVFVQDDLEKEPEDPGD
tara:strand:- start:10075 stop:12276 length:2202 start_codon:yes stop_codon:yes gene_type:complete